MIAEFNMRQFRKLLPYLLPAVIILLSMCSEKGGGEDPDSPKVAWKTSQNAEITQPSAGGTSTLVVTAPAGTKWTAEVVDGISWCSFKHGNFTDSAYTEGTVAGALTTIYVYTAANVGHEARTATIEFTFEGKSPVRFYLRQLSSEQDNELRTKAWPELPAQTSNPKHTYLTHYAELGGATVRNYSICFDEERRAALWVAYPLHSCYIGGESRSDAWAFDPSVSVSVQANCVSRSYGGNYDRGHQLPSADRTATSKLNAQTFYMTNMTPQLNRLNQDMWARLEKKVRSWNCADTLYVVTGAHFENDSKTTTDGAGTTVRIPTHYFKVLLRSKSGRTGKAVTELAASDLISIGFWVEHRSYGDVDPSKSMGICTSVADIEEKTGLKFFPALSNDVAESVKQQFNPTQWGIN